MNNVYAALMTALIVAVLYLAVCALSPYARCVGCTGKRRPTHPALCEDCDGAGVRQRVGVRVLSRAAGR